MLSSYRVLDLTDERGQLCGHILASLGAEVVAVEPPGGARSRRMEPRAGGVADPAEGSLFHWSYNRGKRSVVVDLESAEGRDTLRDLAAGADFLIESAGPGVMAARGLGYADLAALNPALIYVSISAFGSDGPKAGWAASDLTILAAAGQLSLTGDEDRAPVRISIDQAYHQAASEAAAGALIALHERQHHSGLGQHVDASAQQSVLQAAQSMMLAHPLNASHLSRVAGGVKIGPIHIQLMWPCADGHVSVTFLFRAAIGPFTQNLMDWVHEQGFCDEATRSKDWIQYANLIFSGQEPVSEYERLKRVLADFFATKTKAELLEAAFARRLLITPVTTIHDVLESPQLADRGYWEDVAIPGVGPVRFPGAMAKLSATPLTPLGPPPGLGADTEAVLAEPPRRPQVAIRPAVGAAPPGRPLRGLKVLDLMWVMAGPAGSRVLADYGAEVVRVESANRIDTARTLQPFRDDGNGPDDSGLFNNMNAGKLGLALDLSKPAAKDVVLDLVRWADVVLESFSPKAMRGWGLDYDSLRAVKPDVVMLSSCLMGQSGPYASLAGFGTMAAAISGFFNITGWPDRPPCGPFGAYTDYVSPRFLVSCLLAAVEHHRATGEGQYIDLSQAEASLHLLTPALLDQGINAHIWERMGNDDLVRAPHGVYRARGEDAWLAVAVETDDQWRALARVLGCEGMADLGGADRHARRAELDQLVAAWVADRDPAAAQEVLQSSGVPAHQVQNTVECFEDPQLRHRGHFVEVAHATQGTTWVEGSRFRLSRTPAEVTRGGPTFGEHTWDVLSELLGYDADRIADLAAAELLE